jgi:CRISPR-associated RAMP protein (TIGR02581 family)
MLKKLVNEAYCTLRITTTGPLLIKSGQATISGPDMTPVLTFRNGRQEVFLPGSSLKGVFRSHIEKIVCSLKPQVVCYPFSGHEDKEIDHTQREKDYRDSCGDRFNKEANRSERDRHRIDEQTDYVYAQSCPTCRLFGSTGFIGRIAISDAYLANNTKGFTEERDGVGIDRLSGGASHGAKFELEVVSSEVTFETDIHLRNFEIWQLGMFFVVLQDMADQLIHLGSGRSRGLGQVKAEINTQEQSGRHKGLITSTIRDSHRANGEKEPSDALWGMGAWLNDGAYGTAQDDLLHLPQPLAPRSQGIRQLRVFDGDALASLQAAAIEDFIRRMQGWSSDRGTPALSGIR